MFSMSLGTSIGGFLELGLGFNLTTLIGVLSVLVANIFMINIQNIWFCYFLTLIMGTGVGLGKSLLGKNLTLYKPNKKGLITSVLSAINILLAGIFAIIGEKIINPKGHTLTEDEEYYKYEFSSRTYLYFTLGFFSLPIGTLIFLLFSFEYKKNEEQDNEQNKEEEEKTNETNKEINNSNGKQNEVEKKDNNIEASNEIDNNKSTKNEELILNNEVKALNKKNNYKKVIKTFRFWRIALIQLLITFSFSYIVNTGRTFGALIGIDGQALQYLMICQVAALIFIGPILGITVDKKGPLNLLRITALVCIIPGVILTLFIDNTAVFIISFILSVMSLISSIVGFSPFIMEVYGIQESVILGGIIGVFSKLSEITTTVAAFGISFIYTKKEIIKPYRIMYIIGSGFCVLSLILLMFEKKDKFKYDEDNESNEDDLGSLVDKDRITETKD